MASTTQRASTDKGSNAAATPSSKLVMQIILPKSLVTNDQWPTGPLMAQAAHASNAVLYLNAESPEVQTYLSDWANMRKAVLEVEDVDALKRLCTKLDGMKNKIPYHLWIEQPENIPTALALAPNTRPNALRKIFDSEHVTLWK